MNIVDSSGWLEYFTDGNNADAFATPLEKPAELLVPAITVYEVFRVILREKDENSALQAVALMQQGRVIDLTAEIAMSAAVISHTRKIPMADSIILATAHKYNAEIWTQDEDFMHMPRVRYFAK
ncbi:type II toxin-antitoxin system VapC family toxin [bacterium]|nr:type II toxin-antitoxin system VapC family toxin [bacterium]